MIVRIIMARYDWTFYLCWILKYMLSKKEQDLKYAYRKVYIQNKILIKIISLKINCYLWNILPPIECNAMDIM